MYEDEYEVELEEEVKPKKVRKNATLQAKIASAVLEAFDTDEVIFNRYDNPDAEKELARVIKRVIRKHDAGK